MKISKKLFFPLLSVVLIICLVIVSGNKSSDDGFRLYRMIANSNTVQDAQLKIQEEDMKSFIELQGLPSLQRMNQEDQKQYIKKLQITQKIEKLHLEEKDFLYPEKNLKTIYKEILDQHTIWDDSNIIYFDGKNTLELNDFLKKNKGKKIELRSKEIILNESVIIPAETSIIGNETCFIPSDTKVEKAFIIENVKNVSLSGIVLQKNVADYGVYIIDSSNIEISGSKLYGMTKKPVVIMGENNIIKILSNYIYENKQGGIYLNGNISKSLIEDNRIFNNGGTSNWMAGIVLTGINIKDKHNPYAIFRDDLHFPEEQKLDSMLDAPNQIIIRNNTVENNNSSGIYCDGSYNCYVVENRIINNDKEGMCLDYGTIGTYVNKNNIINNGRRFRQTDKDLNNDFVLEAGRMSDGSSNSKLPGISIDNAAYNIISNNNIEKNYGSGVKCVRTSIRNIISTNIIHHNNLGQNLKYHFFGIELGFAAADVPADNLDFSPDYENIICRNMVTGEHYAGIFIAEECYTNDFFDNTIMDCKQFSIESLSKKHNSTANNYSNLPSRGISLSNHSNPTIILPSSIT